MTSEAIILSRLAAIEQQNQQMLALLAKLAGIQAQPILAGLQKEEAKLIALARVDRAAAIAESKRRCRESGRKKQSPAEVRA